MMTTIKLYGKLGRLFGRVHKADLSSSSPAEAVAYLKANFRGIEDYLVHAKSRDGVGFAVFRGKENLKEDQLKEPSFGEEIRIAPVIIGSKRGGILNIIVGVVLIVVGAYASTFGLSPEVGVQLIGAGIAMVAGGVIQMLTPRPKGLSAQDRPESTPSYSFNGPINTQAQGHCVPVLYGRGWVGSAVISAGMDIKDDIVVPAIGQNPGGGNAGGGGMGGFNNGVNRIALA